MVMSVLAASLPELRSSLFEQWPGRVPEKRVNRDMVQEEIRREKKKQEEPRQYHGDSKEHGKRWNMPEKKLTWTELCRMEPFCISLFLRSVYEPLPVIKLGAMGTDRSARL